MEESLLIESLVVILPNFYNPASNGHVIALRIYKALHKRLKAATVVAISGTESDSSVAFYKSEFGEDYLSEDSGRCASLMQSPFALLCPDDIQGARSRFLLEAVQSSQCRQIHVIAFAPPGIFAPGRSLDKYFNDYDERFRIAFFANWIAPPAAAGGKLFCLYQEPAMEAMDGSLELSSSCDMAIYAGKGLYNLRPQQRCQFSKALEVFRANNKEIHLITRTSPPVKSELVSMLSRCALLVCLDPFSNIEREAVLAGCSVWKPNSPVRDALPGVHGPNLCTESISSVLRMDSGAVLERKMRISDDYREYSILLQKSSATRLSMYIKALDCSLSGRRGGPLERLNNRLIMPFTDKLRHGMVAHAQSFLEFVYPIPHEEGDYDYPEANNRLPVESCVNLMMGAPETADELRYLLALA